MPNRLSASTSPYLRQHRNNPVDWFEWGDAAIAEAHRRDVPILLSIGYSACHWCHVMAHESFEDEATAAEMNTQFVNVKVDREERPDVDAIYMEAVQAMTGQGGWPMTVFLTPAGLPLYAGTYFPPTDRHGAPAFRKVMAAVTDAWVNRRDEALEQGERLRVAIDRRIPAVETLPGTEVIVNAFRHIEEAFDPVNGGFGGAPKFPQQPVLEFLLRLAKAPFAPGAEAMLAQTLTKMARGGIYDQIGGGFARYSVDQIWMVPHFEKMLYDNAQLARLYLWTWRQTGNELFRQVAEETLEYLTRDLRHPDGGFYSAEDADSEGVEGKFYVWSLKELVETLGSDLAPIAIDAFGVTEEGNFEHTNILHRALLDGEVAERNGIALSVAGELIERAKHLLLERRAARIRPGLDYKVVASWNGIAIRAFAEAGAALERPDLTEIAREAARFVLDRMRRADGRLYRSWSEGDTRVNGFLEDHASVAMGLFTLYATTGEVVWFREGETITRLIPRLFSDPEGGFYTTADDADPLIKRPKDQMDNPLPSGNSLAAEALLHLSLYTGDSEMRAQTESVIRSGGLLIERYPSAVGHLASVLATMLEGTFELAIVGPDAYAMSRTAWELYRPGMAVAFSETGVEANSVPLLSDRLSPGKTLAYLCKDFACARPVASSAALATLLSKV